MKKLLPFLTIIFLLCALVSKGQIADGSTAPDFTFTDLNGNTQNLYTYLNQGKYVALDISATWCSPCWAYHRSGVMDSLYTLHDTPGDQKWKVFFIESDGYTNLADLQGTGTNTQGDWISGSLFPIMNPDSGPSLNDFIAGYNISFVPTLYMICPNKKVCQDTLNNVAKPPVRTWEYAASTGCLPSGIDNVHDANPLTIYPNPAKSKVVLYFGLNNSADVVLSVTNMLGQLIATKNWGRLPAGDQSLKYDLEAYKPGIYFFTVSVDSKYFVRKKVIVQ